VSERAHIVSRPDRSPRARGQSLVEFVLVMPIIFVLLITIGDFGRYFASGVNLESAARASAEVAAQEYNRQLATAGISPDYTVVHRAAWSSVCDETKGLPNMTYNGSAVECDGVPTIVCVHDGVDPDCSNQYNGAGGFAANCASFDPGVAPSNAQAGGSETSMYVEVRVCYRFNTFFDITLPFIGGAIAPLSGDWILERTRMFTVADY
jgi:hypothetical protein